MINIRNQGHKIQHWGTLSKLETLFTAITIAIRILVTIILDYFLSDSFENIFSQFHLTQILTDGVYFCLCYYILRFVNKLLKKEKLLIFCLLSLLEIILMIIFLGYVVEHRKKLSNNYPKAYLITLLFLNRLNSFTTVIQIVLSNVLLWKRWKNSWNKGK